MRILIAVVVVVLGVAAAIGGSYLLSLRAIHDSEQALCPVLELLTRHPVARPADPAANPSRVQDYDLYLAAVHAEHRYRCAV